MKKTYTESIYYQIRLTARYLKVFGSQMFDNFNFNVSFDEFIALDVINTNEAICQRDLAKILLKDRANTGKIASNLEKKGLIEIVADTKKNRLIKKLTVTKQGQDLIKEVLKKIEPTMKIVQKKITEKEEFQILESLKKVRDLLDTLLETQI